MLPRISKLKSIALAALLLAASVASARHAHAASLYISPASSKASVGNIVSVNVLVDTAGRAINNANATIQFPTDLLQVISVGKGSSIFSLWVEDPQFSNLDGTISFDGGIPNPGFTGQGGQLVSIVFRARKQGTASVVMGDSSVRQNDGLGTDILTSRQGASIQIGASIQPDALPAPRASDSAPATPVISSATNPQQDTWYSGTSASFSWNVPLGVSSIQTLLSVSPTAAPTIAYDGSVTQRTVSNLSDGVLYFHLRFMNSFGWSPTAHYKVQIDSTPPEKFSAAVRTEGLRTAIPLQAADLASGVASYSIQVDDAPAVRVQKDAVPEGGYILPVQSPGSHSLSVLAYDKAGNHTEAQSSFVSSAIPAPQASVSSGEIMIGDTLTVSGTSSYPDAPIIAYVRTDGGRVKAYAGRTGHDGSFSIISDKITRSGSAHAWAQLEFADGVKSPASDPVSVKVSDLFGARASKSAIYVLSFAVPALALLLGFIFMLYLGWHRFFGLKRKMQKDMQAKAGDIHKALMGFKDELGKQLNKLEKIRQDRDLNAKEGKIFKELQSNIDDIDSYIDKKLRKIR